MRVNLEMKRIIHNVQKMAIRFYLDNGLDKYLLISKMPFVLSINRRIRRNTTPKIVNVLGHKMYLDDLDTLHLAINGVWEPLETNLVKNTIKEGDVVLNIGANIGYYTLLAARLVGPKGKVYAFEPDKTNFEIIKKNIRINNYENIIPVNKAVLNKTGKAKLYLSTENKGSHRIYQAGDSRKYVEIDVVSIDDFFKNKEDKVDFILMDIEGSEAKAFEGMKKVLRKNKKVKILTEFWDWAIEKAGDDSQKFIEEIVKTGFKISYMDEDLKKLVPIKKDEVISKLKEHKRDALNLFLSK